MSELSALAESEGYEVRDDDAGLGRLPNKRFCRPPRGAKIASVATLALLAVNAYSGFKL